MSKKCRQSKREYLLAIWERYQRVGRRFKSKILDEFCAVCGYTRKYAIGLLSRKPRRRQCKPGPRRRYDGQVLEPLVYLIVWSTVSNTNGGSIGTSAVGCQTPSSASRLATVLPIKALREVPTSSGYPSWAKTARCASSG